MSEGGWRPRPQGTKSAPNYVIDQIREALFSRELKPGDRLPSETELGNMFSVSRGSVRQAMKSLESLGVVSIRPGDGTYVNDILSENSFNPLAFALLISTPTSKTLTDARYALERDIFELILEKDECVEQVIPKLEQNLRDREEMLSNNESVEKLIENDQEFHRILSRSCIISSAWDNSLGRSFRSSSTRCTKSFSSIMHLPERGTWEAPATRFSI